MKNLFVLALSTVFIATFLTNCSKPVSYDCYFYSTLDSNTVPLTLYVNNENKGILPRFANDITLDSTILLDQTIHLVLPEEVIYNLKAKDSLDNVKYLGTINFSHSKNSSSSGGTTQLGGSSSITKDKKMLVKLYY